MTEVTEHTFKISLILNVCIFMLNVYSLKIRSFMKFLSISFNAFSFIFTFSSINRVKKEVTISSQFQLAPSGKSLELVLCRFEPTILTGVSIDGLLNEFKALGYNTDILNNKLESCGFEIGMSARKRTFILHEMLLYKVDDSFPRITPESFIGGVLPEGITKISYTVDLSGLSSVSLIKGEDNDIQNN